MDTRQAQLERIQLALEDMYGLIIGLGLDPGELLFDPGPNWHAWGKRPHTIGQALGQLATRLEQVMAEEL